MSDFGIRTKTERIPYGQKCFFFKTKEITDEFTHNKFNFSVGFVETRKVKSNNRETSQLDV